MSARRNHRISPKLERLEQRLAPSLTPVGPEFRVNQETADHQKFAKVGVDDEGNYVVAYHGYTGGQYPIGIAAQRYAKNGIPLGATIEVGPAYWIGKVDLAVNNSGQFVVVWDYPGAVDNPNGRSQVYCRRYDSNGQPMGDSFLVHAPSNFEHRSPTVAINEDGSFVVSWNKALSFPPTQIQLLARWFTTNGVPITAEVVVGDLTEDTDATLARQVSGDTVITWGTASGAMLRRYDSWGLPIGNQVSVPFGSYPSILNTSSNELLVVWNGVGGIYCQYFSPSGSPIGALMNLVSGNCGVADAEINDSGNMVVTWTSIEECYIQSFDSQFVATSPILKVNTIPYPGTWFWTIWPKVAVDSDGNALVVYWSRQFAGLDWDIYARLYLNDAIEVSQSFINGGVQQRSIVSNISVSYNCNVVFPTNPSTAFTLTGPNGPVPFQLDLTGSTPAGTVAKLNFPGGLPNGHYNLVVHASMIHDTAGQPMGADYVLPFHRLLGDFDGDARVDSDDFMAFRTAFGTQTLVFDLNEDGQVDSGDFVMFRSVFGLGI